jgi:thioredoxin reductase (NADPH)
VHVLTISGSGCIAALEAEKWLAEQDEETAEELTKANVVEKPNNPIVPEYKQNPLL